MADILKIAVFCHRIKDDKDFSEVIVCVPPSQATVLEEKLRERQASGLLDTVQTGRIYVQATVHTPYVDGIDKFLARIDKVPA